MAWSRKSLHLTEAGGPPVLPEAFTDVPEYELGTSFLGTEAWEPFLRCWSLRDWAVILGGAKAETCPGGWNWPTRAPPCVLPFAFVGTDYLQTWQKHRGEQYQCILG